MKAAGRAQLLDQVHSMKDHQVIVARTHHVYTRPVGVCQSASMLDINFWRAKENNKGPKGSLCIQSRTAQVDAIAVDGPIAVGDPRKQLWDIS